MSLTNLSIILSILSLLGVGYCLWQTMSLNRLRKSFFSGTQAVDLEEVILSLNNAAKTAQENQIILDQEIIDLKNNLSFATQKIGLVRFNPFGDGGGNFSFCLALLDAHDSGVVVTSMHGRQQNRIYSKRILNGKSESQLTEEEQQALMQANQKMTNHSK